MNGAVAMAPPRTETSATRSGSFTSPPPAHSRLDPVAALIVAAAAAGVILAAPSPTGRPVVDAALVGASAAAVTAVGARAPWWILALASVAAIAIAGGPHLIAAATIGLVLAAASRRGALPGAALATLSVGLTINVLARARLDLDFGVTSIISISACAVVVIAGLGRCSHVVRRISYAALAALGIFAVVSTVLFGLAAIRARHDFADGVRTAEVAVAALEHGNYEEAAEEFARSAASLERAHAELSSPWAMGAGVIPIVAQHYDAAVNMSATGADGAAVVADALDDIDSASLQIEQGHVDLAAVTALAGPLDQAEQALQELHATVEKTVSPWLIGRADYEMADFQESVAAHLPQLENAIDAVGLAPRLLGADGLRSFLILFTNPVEARPFGGAVAGYAELRADQGQLSIAAVGGGRAADTMFDNLPLTPDFPRVGVAARDAYTEATGRTVDGVIAMDPQVLATLIGYAGPIHVESFNVDIDRWYAAHFLLHDQYTIDPGAGVPLPDAMDEVIPRTLDALLAGTLPDPTTLARDLGRLASDRRLQMWSADPPAQRLLDDVGLSEELPALDGGEGWAVTLSNAAGNHLDGFLVPMISYQSTVDPHSGSATATLRVRLINNAGIGDARADVIDNDLGLEPGTSRMYVSAYSSLALGEATVDGAPLATESSSESGWNVYSQFVDIGPGDVVTIEYQLAGHVARPGEVVTWQQPIAVEAA